MADLHAFERTGDDRLKNGLSKIPLAERFARHKRNRNRSTRHAGLHEARIANVRGVLDRIHQIQRTTADLDGIQAQAARLNGGNRRVDQLIVGCCRVESNDATVGTRHAIRVELEHDRRLIAAADRERLAVLNAVDTADHVDRGQRRIDHVVQARAKLDDAVALVIGRQAEARHRNNVRHVVGQIIERIGGAEIDRSIRTGHAGTERDVVPLEGDRRRAVVDGKRLTVADPARLRADRRQQQRQRAGQFQMRRRLDARLSFHGQLAAVRNDQIVSRVAANVDQAVAQIDRRQIERLGRDRRRNRVGQLVLSKRHIEFDRVVAQVHVVADIGIFKFENERLQTDKDRKRLGVAHHTGNTRLVDHRTRCIHDKVGVRSQMHHAAAKVGRLQSQPGAVDRTDNRVGHVVDGGRRRNVDGQVTHEHVGRRIRIEFKCDRRAHGRGDNERLPIRDTARTHALGGNEQLEWFGDENAVAALILERHLVVLLVLDHKRLTVLNLIAARRVDHESVGVVQSDDVRAIVRPDARDVGQGYDVGRRVVAEVVIDRRTQ